jgi:hypothetical protein
MNETLFKLFPVLNRESIPFSLLVRFSEEIQDRMRKSEQPPSEKRNFLAEKSAPFHQEGGRSLF